MVKEADGTAKVHKLPTAVWTSQPGTGETPLEGQNRQKPVLIKSSLLSYLFNLKNFRMKKNTIATFGFPDSDALAALGRLVIMQGHLEYVLKMTIKSLMGISIKEALLNTSKSSGKDLRKKIQKLAKNTLIEGITLEELLNLIDRSWKAAEKRNQFVHNVWARMNFSDLHLQNDDHSWRIAPTREEIDDLTNEISNILATLNDSRLAGPLAAALEKK